MFLWRFQWQCLWKHDVLPAVVFFFFCFSVCFFFFLSCRFKGICREPWEAVWSRFSKPWGLTAVHTGPCFCPLERFLMLKEPQKWAVGGFSDQTVRSGPGFITMPFRPSKGRNLFVHTSKLPKSLPLFFTKVRELFFKAFNFIFTNVYQIRNSRQLICS